MGSPLEGLKFKHYTKSLVASKWHDPRYFLVADFLLASRNCQLAGLKLDGRTVVMLNNLHNKLANKDRVTLASSGYKFPIEGVLFQ